MEPKTNKVILVCEHELLEYRPLPAEPPLTTRERQLLELERRRVLRLVKRQT